MAHGVTDAGAHPVHDQIARHLEQRVSGEEHVGAEGVGDTVYIE